jgi:hypothetical protein
VLGGVVVLVVVVEFDSAGPDSLDARATTAAPAMIRTAEQIAAKIFQFIDGLRPGSVALTDPAICTTDGVVEFRGGGLLGPLPTWRRARRVVLQFLPGAKVARRGIGATSKQNETWLGVAEVGADHHERLKAHVVDSARK